jgi:hypothetical protein
MHCTGAALESVYSPTRYDEREPEHSQVVNRIQTIPVHIPTAGGRLNYVGFLTKPFVIL